MIVTEDDGFPPDGTAGWRDFWVSFAVGFGSVALFAWAVWHR